MISESKTHGDGSRFLEYITNDENEYISSKISNTGGGQMARVRPGQLSILLVSSIRLP